MILKIQQKYKEYYESGFDILDNQNNLVGSMKIVGSMGSMEGKWTITFGNKIITLEKFYTSIFSQNKKLPNGMIVGRPYKINLDQEEVGYIYQEIRKTGLFLRDYIPQLLYLNSIYTRYGIIKDDFFITMIYSLEKQIVEIEKDMTTLNMLHNYNIYAEDQDSALIGILFVAYQYTISGFNPGVKPTGNYKETTKIIKREESDLKYYNPNFKNNIINKEK